MIRDAEPPPVIGWPVVVRGTPFGKEVAGVVCHDFGPNDERVVVTVFPADGPFAERITCPFYEHLIHAPQGLGLFAFSARGAR